MKDKSHLRATAATLAKHLVAPNGGALAVQLFVRDSREAAHLTIGEGNDWSLADGRHPRPSLTLYLDTADITDISELGCVRGYVAAHGDEKLVSSFRSQFMSISPAGKELIERKTALSRHGEIERIDTRTVSTSVFLERHAVGSAPVVIKDAMPLWRENRGTIEDLQHRFADHAVSLRVGDYATHIYREEMETQVTKLGPYLERCVSGSTPMVRGVPEYGANNIVPIEWSEWIDYPPFVPRPLCSYAKFWVGPAGTVTPLHRDWADNFLTQLVGTKEIALLSPSCASAISPRVVHPLLDSCNWIDPYRLDDRGRDLQPLFVTLNPGEILFLPAGWFHHVRSTSLSLSINFFLQRVPYAACPPRSH